ncbi:sucrose-6-phosphate hydrolase [Gottfriedia acidiceleris]|uniref:glycoside hydrolase family 32 protein n=1 Tax=Gottfriedia acidiceleris TaxID=371036 RepID=UPI002F2623DD
MEWTKELLYRQLEEVSNEELAVLKSKVDNCPWRQSFHIQPNTGLLNDPNGFAYFNGEYHLFYQWFPLGPVHGLKYWYHVKSKDLVHWENDGIGVKPNKYYDSHGVYSGSAIEHKNNLYLFYTGNTRDEHWVRHPFQCIAIMGKKGEITKLDTPVISYVPHGYTDHFRDPKVWKVGELFYAIIGAQRSNKTGCVVLYSSPDLFKWTFEGEIRTKMDSFGYMWECPDYFELQNQGVLIFSPQGIEPEGDKYQNIYQSGYVLGKKLDLLQKVMEHGEFIELDRGFDFYAPQTTIDSSGRRLLVGWMGLPEIKYPTDQNGWAHCLTIPRELSVQNGKLIQQPVKELESLRKQEARTKNIINRELKMINNFTGTSYEMICEFENIDASEFGVEFRTSKKEKTVLTYDVIEKKVILDRTFSGKTIDSPFGTIRKCSQELKQDKIKIHMFVDVSSVEIFINDGEEVITSRIFPKEESTGIRFFASGGSVKLQAVKWDY